MQLALKSKLIRLEKHLKTLQNVTLAYSGGTDSAFLLWMALKVLGREKVKPVLIRSELIPATESKSAINLAQNWGAQLHVLDREELEDPLMQANLPVRCYYCKKSRYKALLKTYNRALLDGTNTDDLKQYRPGIQALKELKVVCPLLEAGLSKAEIRTASQIFALPTATKPASGCLATRIPYGTLLTREKIQQVAKAEQCLEQLGFLGGRVRHYGKTALIEISQETFTEVLATPCRTHLITEFKKLGFTFIALDLEGYRSGSLNLAIERGEKG